MAISASFAESMVTELEEHTQRVLKNLLAEDTLGVVIRGHLYVESRLMELIESALPDPGAIDLTRLSFLIKLDLCVALELLTESQKRAYGALNAMRNQMAHNADIQLQPADEARIYKVLNRDQRKNADKYATHFPHQPLLRAGIFSLFLESLSLALWRKVNKSVPSSPSGEKNKPK
jgi:hypothetical protein